MAIILKNGAIFLHIPKTGGNWVTKILEELDLIKKKVSYKHAGVDQFFAQHIAFAQYTAFSPYDSGLKAFLKQTARRILKPKDKLYMFCFVRNPLSWYESWFKYMEQPSRQWRLWGDEYDIYDWHPNSVLNDLGQNSFGQFVRNVNAKRPGYVTELYGWYTKPQIDFIGKQESLADDFIKVLKIMNIKFDEDFVRNYGEVGASPTPEREVTWPDDLKLETALFEYAGMVRYGYQSILKEIGIDIAHLASHNA